VNLPPGTSMTFRDNPIRPGQSTVMTLHTTRPIITDVYSFDVNNWVADRFAPPTPLDDM